MPDTEGAIFKIKISIMKKSLLCAFCFFIWQWGFAQMSVESVKNGNYGTPQQRVTEMTEQMSKGLQLTTQQRPKVQAINLKYAEIAERDVVKQSLSSWSKYRKIMSIQADKDAELRPVLTAEQFKKYQKKRDELLWEGVKAMLYN
jgi:hypothetical protein